MGLVADLVAVPVLVRVETNGRLHIRYRLFQQAISRSGLVFPQEEPLRTVDDGRCGIDENWVEEAFEILSDADPARLCQFCFQA